MGGILTNARPYGITQPMSWNYRIVRRRYPNGEELTEIVEVYYDSTGKPDGFGPSAVRHVASLGDGPEDVKGKLADILEKYRNALTLPVLEASDLGWNPSQDDDR